MTQTSIRISNLSPKITDNILKSSFSTIGTVLNVNLFDDSTGNKCALVAFESELMALQAIKEFDGKDIIKKKVKIEIVSNNKSTQSEEIVLDKEKIGELVFPIAKKLYSSHAAKLTGMIVESILSLKNHKSDAQILDILNMNNLIDELVEAAHEKLNKA